MSLFIDSDRSALTPLVNRIASHRPRAPAQILSSQQSGLDHLTRTLQSMARDVDVVNEAFGLPVGKVVVGGGGGGGVSGAGTGSGAVGAGTGAQEVQR